MALRVEFSAEVKGISTGKMLGEEQSGAIDATVKIKGNALSMPLAKLVRLQKAGLCLVTIEPTQTELLGTEAQDEKE